MKKHYLLSLLVLFAVVLASCAPAAAPAEEAPAAEEAAAEEAPAEEAAAEEAPAAEAPTFDGEIKVANLSPLTGPVPTYGESTTNAFKFAIAEWNAAGGVLGKEIVPVVEDSQCTPDPAVNAANKVIDQDGVHYIVGEVCSSASLPVALISEEKHIVQISPTSTNEGVTLNADGSTKQYVFRACFIDAFQGLVMAKFAKDEGYETAFIMFDQGNDYVRGLAEEFEKNFTEMGGQVVGKESYTKGDTDFSAILAKVADSGAEVLYLPDYYPVVNLVGAQAKEKGVTAVMMGGDGWDSADLDLAAADGGYYSNHYSPEDSRQIVVDWVSKYKEEYGAVPDALATLAYDATNLMLAAIDAAGVDDPTAVAAAMETLSYDAVSGTVTFDEFHNPIKGAVVLQVKDGNIDFVTAVAP
ncbi:MAG: ABC transporter substrate-binding protein [Anaerolineaceae bacterium]|nr:ABC transporter substrate-binding protein [Anaerolineaceae bacterium]